MLNKAGASLLKTLLFYFIILAILGIMIAIESGLSDAQLHGDFFMRTSFKDMVSTFFLMPVSALYLLLSSMIDLKLFQTSNPEAHLIILLFLGLAFVGFLRHSKPVLVIAALTPIFWAMIDLDFPRYY